MFTVKVNRNHHISKDECGSEIYELLLLFEYSYSNDFYSNIFHC